eukprot:gnl/TRDRNA2_/TRDRNA2_36341_c1_seq1.p1 gnl/TRDRNA2_/TRDRNA2_36341_c1~~gnl/TRDRNA2_/TRDRNA2_36341_c1_seq1.p1  ORF type:complete len:166 (-),score=20.23 gnl/TRDRNA2_/TRDRNA2_36341_c1_seq1:32-499(-)
MDRVDRLEGCAEVSSRLFFLGLREDDLRRGLLITMDRSAHGITVMEQGHLGFMRAQILLLCRTHQGAQLLLYTLRVMMTELLLHQYGTHSATSTFRALSAAEEKRSGETSEEDIWSPPTDVHSPRVWCPAPQRTPQVSKDDKVFCLAPDDGQQCK